MILRELLVRIGLDVNAQSFAKGQLLADGVKLGLQKLVDLAHKFKENVFHVVEYGEKIRLSSQSIGIATDALQELHYAGSLANLTAEDMSTSIGILSRQMMAAKNGGEEAGKAFKGIKFQEGGKLLAADEVLGNIAEKFAKMPDGAEKTALAMQLFGRGGKLMIPLLNESSKNLSNLRQEARDLGLVMSEEAVRGSEELNDNLARLKAVSTGLWRQAIAPLIPALNGLVKRFLEWRKASAAILAQKIREWVGYLISGVKAAVVVFKSIIRVAGFFSDMLVSAGKGIAFLISQVPYLSTALMGLAGILLLVNAPFLALMGFFGALYLIIDDLIVYSKGGKSIFGLWKKSLDEWMQVKPGDAWFVKSLKDFLGLLRDAAGGMASFRRDLSEMVDFVADAIEMYAGLNDVVEGMKQGDTKRVARGVVSVSNVNMRNRPAIAGGHKGFNGFGAPTAPTASYQPEYRPPMSGGSTVSNSMAPNITIVQQPGESAEVLASRIDDRLQSFWDGRMSDAGSSVP